jgi:DNA-binding transcriptional LysR family regulator
MDFDTARFRAFLNVAEHGTVAAAATALGYTGPAISQQITKLESQLGERLFDRVGGRLRLSSSGQQLVPIARQFVDLSTIAEHPGAVASHGQHVVIAGFASALRTLVLPLLASRIAKRVTLDIRELEDEVALRDLRLGHVDLAIIQEYDGAPVARSERLAYVPLLTDRLRLIAPSSWPSTVRPHDLVDVGWLVNGAGTRCEEATTQVLKAAGIVPRITGHIADNHTLLALVAAGHGATIAPELVIAGGPPAVTVSRVDLGVNRTILGVTRTAVSRDYEPVMKQLQTVARNALRRTR